MKLSSLIFGLGLTLTLAGWRSLYAGDPDPEPAPKIDCLPGQSVYADCNAGFTQCTSAGPVCYWCSGSSDTMRKCVGVEYEHNCVETASGGAHSCGNKFRGTCIQQSIGYACLGSQNGTCGTQQDMCN